MMSERFAIFSVTEGEGRSVSIGYPRNPRAFELRLPLEAHLDLTPANFLAVFR